MSPQASISRSTNVGQGGIYIIVGFDQQVSRVFFDAFKAFLSSEGNNGGAYKQISIDGSKMSSSETGTAEISFSRSFAGLGYFQNLLDRANQYFSD